MKNNKIKSFTKSLTEKMTDDEFLHYVLELCESIDVERIRACFASSYPSDFLDAFIVALSDKLKKE